MLGLGLRISGFRLLRWTGCEGVAVQHSPQTMDLLEVLRDSDVEAVRKGILERDRVLVFEESFQ